MSQRVVQAIVVMVAWMSFAGLALGAEKKPKLGLASDGSLQLIVADNAFCTFAPSAADGNWHFVGATPGKEQKETTAAFAMRIAGTELVGEAKLVAQDGGAKAQWSIAPKQDVALNSLAIQTELPIGNFANGAWQADDEKGVFPKTFTKPHFFGGHVRRFTFAQPTGPIVTIAFDKPTYIILQDNRQWGSRTYTVRFAFDKGNKPKYQASDRYTMGFTVNTTEGLETFRDKPVILAEGTDWVPLKYELEIEKGSALDLSGQGFADGACGSKGRVIVTPEGKFAYANDPGTPRRFYGVNFCFSANYMTHAQSDQLLDRLVRLGYNSVRIHHYERDLTKPNQRYGFDWDETKLDQFDYLIAGCAKRGLWVTTDLFVSRPVSYEQIQLPGEAKREVPMDLYKVLVPVYEPAMRDFQAFSRKLLERVNPYTKRRLAEEPALAWISLINEGTPLWHWKDVRQIKEWNAEWNAWLARTYPTREALAKALGDLNDDEDASKGTIALPGNINADERRARVCHRFIAFLEQRMTDRLRKFLRDDLKCEALITNQNAGASFPAMQATRHESYDYVDDHFYIDHPQFIEQAWRLPSRCDNANPIRDGAPGGRGSASLRIWGKPFTVTEFDYSGPGRFRGVGGILTGAMASLQDWDGMWRFAYSHSNDAMFTPGTMHYFNAATDPLKQAADRATMMLYLRRDLDVAPNAVEIAINKDAINDPSVKIPQSPGSWLAWTTRIGTKIYSPGDKIAGIHISATQVDDREAVAARLKEAGINDTGSEGVIRSQTGQITIDQSRGILTIDTPRTAGGYADPGGSIETKAGVSVSDFSVGATVFVTSLDQQPIRASKRLLVTHLTDLQNTGTHYAEGARQTLLAWGKLPHLVRDGSATVRLTIADPARCEVYALSASGKRMERIDAKIDAGRLVFTPSVRGADGARMLYEIVGTSR